MFVYLKIQKWWKKLCYFLIWKWWPFSFNSMQPYPTVIYIYWHVSAPMAENLSFIHLMNDILNYSVILIWCNLFIVLLPCPIVLALGHVNSSIIFCPSHCLDIFQCIEFRSESLIETKTTKDNGFNSSYCHLSTEYAFINVKFIFHSLSLLYTYWLEFLQIKNSGRMSHSTY